MSKRQQRAWEREGHAEWIVAKPFRARMTTDDEYGVGDSGTLAVYVEGVNGLGYSEPVDRDITVKDAMVRSAELVLGILDPLRERVEYFRTKSWLEPA